MANLQLFMLGSGYPGAYVVCNRLGSETLGGRGQTGVVVNVRRLQ